MSLCSALTAMHFTTGQKLTKKWTSQLQTCNKKFQWLFGNVCISGWHSFLLSTNSALESANITFTAWACTTAYSYSDSKIFTSQTTNGKPHSCYRQVVQKHDPQNSWDIKTRMTLGRCSLCFPRTKTVGMAYKLYLNIHCNNYLKQQRDVEPTL